MPRKARIPETAPETADRIRFLLLADIISMHAKFREPRCTKYQVGKLVFTLDRAFGLETGMPTTLIRVSDNCFEFNYETVIQNLNRYLDGGLFGTRDVEAETVTLQTVTVSELFLQPHVQAIRTRFNEFRSQWWRDHIKELSWAIRQPVEWIAKSAAATSRTDPFSVLKPQENVA